VVDPVGVTIRHHMTDAHDGVTAAARRGGKGSHCRGTRGRGIACSSSGIMESHLHPLGVPKSPRPQQMAMCTIIANRAILNAAKHTVPQKGCPIAHREQTNSTI